jgi:hypothetical protein
MKLPERRIVLFQNTAIRDQLVVSCNMHRSLATLVFSLGFVNGQTDWKIGGPVKTTSGTVIGKASSWQPEVSEYLGIPFAKAPEGDLRWAAPLAITDSSQTINATKYVSLNLILEPIQIDLVDRASMLSVVET